MSNELYVVKHQGAWRIRVNGKHHGEYASRVTALNAAAVEAQTAGPGAKVFSSGIISQYSRKYLQEKG